MNGGIGCSTRYDRLFRFNVLQLSQTFNLAPVQVIGCNVDLYLDSIESRLGKSRRMRCFPRAPTPTPTDTHISGTIR
jgi:hypothetical protein